jgi:hypothetical protein
MFSKEPPNRAQRIEIPHGHKPLAQVWTDARVAVFVCGAVIHNDHVEVGRSQKAATVVAAAVSGVG